MKNKRNPTIKITHVINPLGGIHHLHCEYLGMHIQGETLGFAIETFIYKFYYFKRCYADMSIGGATEELQIKKQRYLEITEMDEEWVKQHITNLLS